MRNIYHDKDKLVRAVRKESTKANASLFVISDLTARFLHPRYPPRSTRYEKECRRSGTYTRDDGRYFVGKKKNHKFLQRRHISSRKLFFPLQSIE